MIINVDININLLQQIRAIHALSEINEIYVKSEDYYKLKPIIDSFSCNINKGQNNDGIKLSSILNINHSTPETKINNKVRPLIFPIGLINMCESLKLEKENKIYFRGLLTEKRKNSIEKLKNNTNLNIIHESSNQGRTFPNKSFDINYFNKLSSYNFSYCPSGDFVWSYRFFESIMCKSIPIVEENHLIIKDFKYLTLNDNLNNLTYNKEWVDHNIKILRKNFTL